MFKISSFGKISEGLTKTKVELTKNKVAKRTSNFISFMQMDLPDSYTPSKEFQQASSLTNSKSCPEGMSRTKPSSFPPVQEVTMKNWSPDDESEPVCTLKNSGSRPSLSGSSVSSADSLEETSSISPAMHAVMKADARQAIEHVIQDQGALLRLAKEQMDNQALKVDMRNRNGSLAGALVSMRQLKKATREYDNIQEIIKELIDLSTCISIDEGNPFNYDEQITEILQKHRCNKIQETDRELLEELKNRLPKETQESRRPSA